MGERKMFSDLIAFIKDEEGATVMEYAAVIGAGAVAVLALIALFRLAANKLNQGSGWFGN
jgi:Flp pilus assembly pilin Flp